MWTHLASSFLRRALSLLSDLGARCSEKAKSPLTSSVSRLNRWSGKQKKPTTSYKSYGHGPRNYVVFVRRQQYMQLLLKRNLPHYRKPKNELQTSTLKFSRCRSFTRSALSWVSSLTFSKRLQTIIKTWNSLRSAYTALSKTMQGRLSNA